MPTAAAAAAAAGRRWIARDRIAGSQRVLTAPESVSNCIQWCTHRGTGSGLRAASAVGPVDPDRSDCHARANLRRRPICDGYTSRTMTWGVHDVGTCRQGRSEGGGGLLAPGAHLGPWITGFFCEAPVRPQPPPCPVKFPQYNSVATVVYQYKIINNKS